MVIDTGSKKILATSRGLLTGCKILDVEYGGDNTQLSRVRVKVNDEKYPKWVDMRDGKRALFDNTDDAINWIESL